MSKIDTAASKVPRAYDASMFSQIIRDIAYQVNGLSEGSLSASYNATTAAPTATNIPYAQGDFIKNSNPSEVGAGGSKYVIVGWICTVAGSPGTWLQCRFLTGN